MSLLIVVIVSFSVFFLMFIVKCWRCLRIDVFVTRTKEGRNEIIHFFIVHFYASVNPTDGAGVILFSGCPSIFTCMPRWRHSRPACHRHLVYACLDKHIVDMP